MTSARLPLDALPAWPARLDARAAAAYLGISASKFTAGVKIGRYPAAERDGRRRLWHRRDLDEWLETRRPGGADCGDDFDRGTRNAEDSRDARPQRAA